MKIALLSRLLGVLLAATAADAIGPSFALATSSPQTASATAQATLDQILAALRASTTREAKIRNVEKIVSNRFDFTTMSKLVAARAWRSMTPAQRETFEREFRKHLSITYGRNVDRYTDQTMVVVEEREETRGDRTVRTEIRTEGNPSIVVNYRMRAADGRWQVIDVIVENISLVSNFRAQISQLVGARGIDGMLDTLARKNAAGETILPEEKKSSRSQDSGTASQTPLTASSSREPDQTRGAS